jgi:hypothetical protein
MEEYRRIRRQEYAVSIEGTASEPSVWPPRSGIGNGKVWACLSLADPGRHLPPDVVDNWISLLRTGPMRSPVAWVSGCLGGIILESDRRDGHSETIFRSLLSNPIIPSQCSRLHGACLGSVKIKGVGPWTSGALFTGLLMG